MWPNKRLLVLTLGFTLLTGCSVLTQEVTQVTDTVQAKHDQKERQVTYSTDQRSPAPDDPFYAPIDPQQRATNVVVTGSLFNTNGSRSLFTYTPPFHIGDTITVILEEEAVATKSASSSMAKNSSYTLDPIQVPGGPLTINGNVFELGMSQDQGFDGNAGADQSHQLNARLTVSVIDVLNNGNLVVRGEKWLVINNGKEYLRFTGIVRPFDVSEGNSVSSYQVADARIEFSGTGEQADAQTQGWLASFFNSSLWPL